MATKKTAKKRTAEVVRKKAPRNAPKPRAPFMARQGDVLLFEGEAAPRAAAEVPREGGAVVLAHGKVTGHEHAIRRAPKVRLLRAEGRGDRWLDIAAGATATLTHEEHGPIKLPAGVGLTVRIQREWQGGVSRRVED